LTKSQILTYLNAGKKKRGRKEFVFSDSPNIVIAKEDKMKKLVFITLVILAIPTICSAMPPRPGPYVSGFLGVTFPVTTDVTSTQYGPGAETFKDRVEFDPGINIGGSVGFDFGFLRLEGELSYKNGEMSTITEQISQTRITNVDGRVGALAMMLNAFFDLRNASRFTPYIGGGIGFANLHMNDTFGTETTTGNRTRLYRSDDDTVFAYQAGAGLEIALTNMFSLDLGYRYFGTTKAKFNNHSSTATEMRFESHNASIGFRVKF
jgi:opacity protein-like surface antigen